MELAVHDYGGEGPDLLLLHGGADNIETWRGLVPRLGGFRIAAYDARGHGQSPTPDEVSVPQLVDDVFAVAGRFSMKRPLLVGHSMGGINALLAAASQPDRFAGVVALDSVPRWWSRPDLTVEEFREIGRARKVDWTGTEEELEEDLAAVNGAHAELIRAVLRRNHEHDGDGFLRRKPTPEYALPLAQTYQGRDSGLTVQQIAAIRCPVTLLCSETWVSPGAVGELPRDLRVVWLGRRHHIHWDHPDEVAAEIRRLA